MVEDYLIIVEGKNDCRRLRRVVPEDVYIVSTYGIPSQERLERLRHEARHRTVIVMTDADKAGRRIRRLLKDAFPDALDVHTEPGYNGVEHTPLDYLEERLRRVGVLPEIPQRIEDQITKGDHVETRYLDVARQEHLSEAKDNQV